MIIDKADDMRMGMRMRMRNYKMKQSVFEDSNKMVTLR